MNRQLTFLQAMNEALRQEMARDPAIVIYGEDIDSRVETKGLLAAFGPGRVVPMPISEAGFTGMATGAALAGARPVVVFQVSSLIFPAFDQIVNQAAKLPLMLGGQGWLPVTYLVMGCGAAGGRAGQHSDNPYPYLLHAGIKSVMPSSPQDAKGLLTAALREDDPVAFFGPVRLAGQSGPVPEEAYVLPLGQGEVRRRGWDVTVVAVGCRVAEALTAAEELAGEGVDAEVWDPRSLLPFDKSGLCESVRRTGRLVVFDDSARTCGFAAEVASLVAERCFPLKAPIKRVTRSDVTVPFSIALEPEVLPTREKLKTAVRAVMAY
jgi:pyruvate/2-oxoglutarate/acetoin dehydrogenase E1 component